MGNRIASLIKRLFDYPIKRKPICFYRQEDFASTGEPLPQDEQEQTGPPTEYDKLVQGFYARLLAQRKQNKQEKNQRRSFQRDMDRFEGWDEMTIGNLHSLFLLFDNNRNGMLSYDDFSALLESLGDDNLTELRKKKFEAADADMDGFISYEEYLNLMYTLNPTDQNGNLTGLAKLCVDVAENIRFVSSLSVGEQLEYGLF